MSRVDDIRHEIIPPLKEEKDSHGRIYLHLPLYIDLGLSTERWNRPSNATLAYPIFACFKKKDEQNIMVIGSLSPDGSTKVKAIQLYPRPVESSVRVYALPLYKLCRKAVSRNRPELIREHSDPGTSICMPGFAVAGKDLYERYMKTVFLYLFNVDGEGDCDDISHVYYAQLRLKLKDSSQQEPKSGVMHIIIAGKKPITDTLEEPLLRRIDEVEERGCTLRASNENNCPRSYRVKNEVWPPVAIIKNRGRTGYVKSTPLNLTLLVSAREGRGSLVNKLVGGSIEVRRKASDLTPKTFYVPSSVFFSAWRGYTQDRMELGVLSNAVERLYSDVMIVESEPIDYSTLYDSIREGIDAAFGLLAQCINGDPRKLDYIVKEVLEDASEVYGPAFKLELPSNGDIVRFVEDLTLYLDDYSDNYANRLIDPKLLAKILLNQATMRASLSLAQRGKRLVRYMVPVTFKRIVDIVYPTTMLLPGARKVNAGSEHRLAYTVAQYDGHVFTRFSQLYTIAAKKLGRLCRVQNRLEKDTLNVLVSWIANASFVYHSKYRGETPLTLSIKSMVDTAALVGSIMGLHALSHMQMRRVASRYGIGRRSIREYIVLTAPGYAVSGIQDAIQADNTTGVILQGGTEVWSADSGSPGSRMRAWILTINMQEGSGYMYEQRHSTGIGDIVSELRLYTGGQGYDACYANWMQRAPRLSSRVNAYLNTLLSDNAEFAGVIDEARRDTLDVFSPGGTAAVSRVFYPPVEIAQKVMEKRISAILKRRAASGLGYSFLIGHLARSRIPECFDACYNCVLDEYCFIPQGDLQRMLTSKAAARMLDAGAGGGQSSPAT